MKDSIEHKDKKAAALKELLCAQLGMKQRLCISNEDWHLLHDLYHELNGRKTK